MPAPEATLFFARPSAAVALRFGGIVGSVWWALVVQRQTSPRCWWRGEIEVEEWEKSSMDKGRLSLRPSATGMCTSHMLTEKPYIGEARAMPLASRVGEKAGDHHPILYIFRTCSLPCLHTTPRFDSETTSSRLSYRYAPSCNHEHSMIAPLPSLPSPLNPNRSAPHSMAGEH